MPDGKKKHVVSFGKGQKGRRLQLRQARAGHTTPVGGSDSDSDANDSDTRHSPVISQLLFFLLLSDKILSRVHVYFDNIII